MSAKNYYNLSEALKSPTYAKELCIFLRGDGEYELLDQIDKLVNLTSLSILDGPEFNSLPAAIFKLEKLEYLRLRGIGISELTEALGELSSLKQLQIEDCPIEILPESIAKLDNLQRITIEKSKLKTLPNVIGELKELDYLRICNAELTEIPNTIGNLKKLTELQFPYNQLKDLPSSIATLQNIKTLSLVENKFEQLPEVITELKKLAYIYIGKNQLSSLPECFKNLKTLKHLAINDNHFSTFPEVLCGIPGLNYLYIENNHLKSLPESLMKLCNLSTIKLAGNPFEQFPPALFDWYGLAKRNAWSLDIDNTLYNKTKIFDLMQNKTFYKSDRQSKIDFFNIYTENKEACKEIPLERLCVALNSAATRVADLTLAFMTEGSDKKIKKGDKILIIGKTTKSLVEIKEQAEICGIEIQSKISKETTHILISARANKIPAKWPENVYWQWINEGQLMQFFDEVNPSYLVEAAETDAEKVADMIMTLGEDNMELAVSIVEGGGLPEALFTELFIVCKLSDNEALRKRALQLLKQKASPELMTILKNRSSITKKNQYYYSSSDRDELTGKLRLFTKDSGLNLGKLAYAVFLKTKQCITLVLEQASPELKKRAIATIITQGDFSLSYNDYITYFPLELLSFPDIKKIRLFVTHGEWIAGQWTKNKEFEIPDEIYKIEALEELEIWGKAFDSMPVASLLKLRHLKRLSFVVGEEFDIPAFKAMFPNCELDIRPY